ncbi:MAG: methyltransferase domain-containing protein [Opitutaceae bacterium]|nr:methyltransferase domain-containing protein [Opitutaceae bacterium]
MPLDYVRTRELPGVVNLVCFESMPKSCRVLDIASPQLLGLHLGLLQPGWSITYLNPFDPELVQMRHWADLLGVVSVQTIAGDAREPCRFAPGSFDLILCSSVLEHINDGPGAPGDAVVMRNMAGWLAQGGQAVISVPYARVGFEEFTAKPVYGAASAPGGAPNFFQRFYDAGSLNSRLLEPSGLEVAKLTYLGERFYHEDDPRRRLAVTLARSRWRYVLGRLYPWLACCFLEASNDVCGLRKPYIAFASLFKP